MQKTLESFAKIIVYATFAVPLVVAPSSFIFPFIVPKILVFRILTTLLAGSYVLLLLADWERYKPRATPLTLVVSFFIVSFGISTFVGVDPYHSFWDNHERMLGFFTLLHYGVYYVVCTSLFKTWTEWKWALRLFLLAGSVAMSIGLLQVVYPDLLLNQGNIRVGSSLGNAIYVGGYGLFLFFLSLFLIFKEQRLAWRLLGGVVAILALGGLFYSGTRGSMLGLIAGVGLVIMSYCFLLKGHPRGRLALIGVMAAGALTLGVLYAYRHTPAVARIPALGRLLNISWVRDTTTTRFIAWRIAWEGWKAHPIFGWGPNNYFYTFNQFYNPRSLEFGYGETWFDNAHNIVLNTLTVQGLAGIAAYLGIFGVAIFGLWRSAELRNKQTPVVVFGSTFLVAHLVQNVTVFENPTSYLYFMFWLALINWFVVSAASANRDVVAVQSAPATHKTTVGAGAIALVGGVCVVIIFIFNIQAARANMKTLLALSAFASDPIRGFPFIQESLQFRSPHIDDIRSDIGRMVVDTVSRQYQSLGKDNSTQFLDVVRTALDDNTRLHPLDIRNYMLLAQLEQVYFAVTNDVRHLLAGAQYLQTSIQYSPRRQQLAYMLANMHAQLGQLNEAVSLMERTITDDPEVPESYWRLAYIYYFNGDLAKAQATLARAAKSGAEMDAQGQQVEQLIKNALGKSGTKK